MTKLSDGVGAYGERRAVDYLTNQAGMWVVDRNWRCREGELDIVARDGDDLVFIEVKTRRGPGFGGPAEAVVPDKVRRLRRLAAAWLAAHPLVARRHGDRNRCGEVRFDVVCVYRPRRGPALVYHVRAAF